MTDNDIYEAYKDYKITTLVWHSPASGCFGITFLSRSSKTIKLPEQMIISFKIDKSNVITLDRWLPEFVFKEIIELIRSKKDEGDQYLWGV